MRYKISHLINSTAIVILLFAGSAISFQSTDNNKYNLKLPYAAEGLSRKQAAAHLLNRLTFGATPNAVAEVEKIGLERWIAQQVDGVEENSNLTEKMAAYPDLLLTNGEIVKKFPKAPLVRKMAIKEGIITEAEVSKLEKKDLAKKLIEFGKSKGLRREADLFRQMYDQKILNAVYSSNQLQQVMTDFWFNHFNVSMTKNQVQQFVMSYERDAIKPNVFGKFEHLLMATTKHPAMLLYLDNAQSSAANDVVPKRKINDTTQPKRVRSSGLNENYAREVMELHTLGVDGGYTQADVTNAAKILTGWTLNPSTLNYGDNKIAQIMQNVSDEKIKQLGIVKEGDFIFVPQRHDKSTKTVLNVEYKNDGYQEGVQLLSNLAHHKSTAYFISKKLATKFINDKPSDAIIKKMAEAFLLNDGDIKMVLFAMLESKEFWAKTSVREKTKSPFEYAVSSLRSLNADVNAPQQINQWLTKMGQQMYHYSAPTGFPDKAQYWINTGSLLNRMNFGLALSSKRISGVSVDLSAINNYHEPESAKDALNTYAAILLPERDLNQTIKRLTPMIAAPDINKKIDDAANKNKANNAEMMMDENDDLDEMNPKQKGKKSKVANTKINGDNSMLAQVVGIIIGSPEFQRR